MRVLFLCTHNSSRSQMAEGLLRARGGPAFEVWSAGTQLRTVHPLAIRAMRQIGIDISTQYAKGIEAFFLAARDTTGVREAPMHLVTGMGEIGTGFLSLVAHRDDQIHRGERRKRLNAFCAIRDLIAAKVNQFLGRNPTFSFGQLYSAAKAEEQQA